LHKYFSKGKSRTGSTSGCGSASRSAYFVQEAEAPEAETPEAEGPEAEAPRVEVEAEVLTILALPHHWMKDLYDIISMFQFTTISSLAVSSQIVEAFPKNNLTQCRMFFRNYSFKRLHGRMARRPKGGHLQGGWSAAVFYPLGQPMPLNICTYLFDLLFLCILSNV
jgi:hypothetical protein